MTCGGSPWGPVGVNPFASGGMPFPVFAPSGPRDQDPASGGGGFFGFGPSVTAALPGFDPSALSSLWSTGFPGADADSAPESPLQMVASQAVSWQAAALYPALATARATADAALFDVRGLTQTERRLLAIRSGEPAPILVAHPQGVRSLARYQTVGEFAISVDGLARAIALVGPGATPLGAAAFARSVANALGEPVIAVPPTFTVKDVEAALLGRFAFGALGDPAETALRPEERTLLDLLIQRPFQVRLAVAHGLGARALARVLFAEVAYSRKNGSGPPDYSRRLVTFGAAPRLPLRFEATRIVGGADPVGWALCDPAVTLDDAPLGVGHHTNTALPGALDVTGALIALARTLGPLPPKPVSRSGGTQQTASPSE